MGPVEVAAWAAPAMMLGAGLAAALHLLLVRRAVRRVSSRRAELLADELAEDLRGTCGALGTVLTEEQEADEDLLAAIDERVFECEECGRWCGRDEESHSRPGVCDECALKEEEGG